MKFDECRQNVATEALARIDLYRKTKNNDCFDSFYHSHLDLMEELLKEYQSVDEKYVSVIITKERKQIDENSSVPRYVTVCRKPHWSHEGVMVTGGPYDATKFRPSSPDLQKILSSLNKDGEKYETVLIDKRCLGSQRNEYWEDAAVRGD